MFDRIGSYDLTDAGVDESQQINWKAINALKARYSVTSGRNTFIKNGVKSYEDWIVVPKALYTCNPKKNWVFSDFYLKHKQGKLEPHRKFIKALPTDNPFVSESYIESLKTADKITRERLLFGNFEYDDDPDLLVSYDAILDCFNNTHVQEGERHITADLALKGRDRYIGLPWHGLIAMIDDASVEPLMGGKDIEQDLIAMKNHVGVRNSNIIADSDGLGGYLESYIEGLTEFKANRSPKDDKFQNIKSECGFKLAELINRGEIRFICTDRQRKEDIITEIQACLKKHNDPDKKLGLIKKEQMIEDLGHSPDWFDVLLMRMLPLVQPSFDALA